MASAVAPIASRGLARAFSFVRDRARVLQAPPSLFASFDALELSARGRSPSQARATVEKAWELLRRALPTVRRRRFSPFAQELVGDEPIIRQWGWYHSPADIDRGRREVDAAFNDLSRRAVAALRRGLQRTPAQQAALDQFDTARRSWGRESARLRDSFWERAWGSGANAVEDGAAAYARARAAMIDAGWPLSGATPGTALPGQTPSSATPFASLFSGGAGIALAAVAAVFILSSRK